MPRVFGDSSLLDEFFRRSCLQAQRASFFPAARPASMCRRRRRLDPGVYELGIPILGICYGLQLIASDLGGAVERSARREYGPGKLRVDRRSDLFRSLPAELDVWNSHGDKIAKLPGGISRAGQDGEFPQCRHWGHSSTHLRFAVPSRGGSYPAWESHSSELCPSHLRVQIGVDDGVVYRAHLRANFARRSVIAG